MAVNNCDIFPEGIFSGMGVVASNVAVAEASGVAVIVSVSVTEGVSVAVEEVVDVDDGIALLKRNEGR